MKFVVALSLLAMLCTASTAVAQTDEFTIRAIIGDDTTSPTDPSILTATPVTATQVDIVWSTSTDNWIFGGYVLLRDGNPVATTTQTSYSDTGLSPLTEYAYSVYAFDAAGNLSSTSAAVSTTTLAIPVAPTSTPPTGSGNPTATLTVVLQNLSVVPGTTSAAIEWLTNIPTRFTFRWGRTDAYTGGYVSNEIYARSQRTEVQGLEPGTTYQYELIAYSPAGIAVSLRRGQFTTVAEVADRVVPNVEHLAARVMGDDVILTYDLPRDESGARVRIVRSHLGFPIDLTDGAIVYEGNANTFRDSGALATFGTEYYTVFVIGSDGTVSSGAVVLANRFADSSGAGLPDTGEVAPSSDFTAPEVLLPLLKQNSIVVTQHGRVQTFLDEGIKLSPHEPFTISISKEALPPHLKSIIVTLLDPTDQRRSYSFLLRINKAGTAYEATIAPVAVVGVSRLQVEVYDYETAVVGRYRTQLSFLPGLEAESDVVFPDAFVKPFHTLIPVAALLALMCAFIFLFFAWRRRTEDKQ